MNLNGKTAIVTGGGRDIGLACVNRLAEAGAKVAINYHSSSAGAEAAVTAIESAGGEALALQGDMTDPVQVDSLVAQTVERFGGVDILVHVTGGLVARKKLVETDLEHWRTVLDLNLTSLFLVAKACVPHMGEGGSIVAMASQAGRDGGGGGASAYATAKGGVMTLTRALAKELGPTIRVNALCPGMIDTDFHNIFTGDEVRSHVANITPLKREGSSQDVANLAVYLASDEAAFITGANVDINGGLYFS